MTELNPTNKFDFELQLKEAQEAERQLINIFKDKKFELKTERGQWHNTNNIVIEYESHGKPSGIAATQADYWVHELRTQDNKTLAYVMFPTPILRKLCNELMDEGDVHWRPGGEKKKMEMILLNLTTLFDRLKSCAGMTDDQFLTRKQRLKK